MSEIVHVAVAVIVNENDEVCISLRHKEAHQGGLWEFPGGKIEPGETLEQALTREIREELSLEIISTRPLITITHKYPDKKICLHVHKVLEYSGQARGLEGQQVKWLCASELHDYAFPEANTPIIKALQLPDRYLITGKFVDSSDFIKKLKNSLASGIKLVQLRLKKDSMQEPAKAQSLLVQAVDLCKQSGAGVVLNLSEDYLNCIDLNQISFDGFHADSRTLSTLSQRPDGVLFSASCHNSIELLKAIELHADFVVLSPVQKTASHPEMQAMGWQQFSTMVSDVSIPVYALGGVSERDIEAAWSNGAQGVAAISAFWK